MGQADRQLGERKASLVQREGALLRYRLLVPPHAVAALALAGLLLVYGNGISALPSRGPYDWPAELANVILMVPLVAWAIRGEGLSLAQLGMTASRLLPSLALGLGLAALVITPVVIYFAFPFGLPGGSIDYEGAEDLSLGSFLVWALLRQPIATSLFEETAFRGVLQATSIRAYGVVRGVLLVAVTFALWHLVINFRTVQDTSAGESVGLAVLAQLASMIGLILGSVFMSVLRLRSGSLAAPIAFHWLVVVAMQGTLFALAD